MKVKIINGNYSYKPEGAKHATCIRRGEVCEVAEAEAERLIALRVAAPADNSDAGAVATTTGGDSGSESGGNTSEAENGAEGAETAHLDPAQLEELTKAKLVQLAEAMEIDVAGLKTKAEIVQAICEAEVTPGDSESEDDGEEPPTFSAEEPLT